MRLTLNDHSAIELLRADPHRLDGDVFLSVLHLGPGNVTIRELAVRLSSAEAIQSAGALIAFAIGGRNVQGTIEQIESIARGLRDRA